MVFNGFINLFFRDKAEWTTTTNNLRSTIAALQQREADALRQVQQSVEVAEQAQEERSLVCFVWFWHKFCLVHTTREFSNLRVLSGIPVIFPVIYISFLAFHDVAGWSDGKPSASLEFAGWATWPTIERHKWRPLKTTTGRTCSIRNQVSSLISTRHLPKFHY